jgi:cytochrome b pre-mRNA-processing protein 3
MLRLLFRRLTAEPGRGSHVFAAVTAEARQPHWYVEGQVPDTIDGRFAMLSTIAALVLVRLEHQGEAGNSVSVALTERFIEVMESEHRELGLGDPALGRKVRKLVASLGGRAETWRRATASEFEWIEAAHRSVYKEAVSPEALSHTSGALERLWARLERTTAESLSEGEFA